MAKRQPKIRLNDASLFGNDAAEDEQEDVFNSYYLERPETRDFLDPRNAFLALRAYRGEGKSAIMRKALQQLQVQGELVVRTTGAAASPEVNSADPSLWTRGWKKRLLGLLAAEIGSKIGMAWTDDAMTLVEEAERNGFKAKSFVSSVVDRLKLPHVPEKKAATPVDDPGRLLQRWLKGAPQIWLLIDDVDENFVNSTESRAKVASFFSACREIVTLIPELRLRTGIRPNIWQIVRADAESLSKVNQYLINLRWDTPTLRALLAKRIEGYLRRTNQFEVLQEFEQISGDYRDEKLISLVFEEEMQWGFNRQKQQPTLRPPHMVMSTLSRGRPRWLIELARLSAKKAFDQNSSKIFKKHIMEVLEGFGRTRIDDLSAEYRSECPEVREVINAFADGREEYSTGELHTLITNRILNHINLRFASSAYTGKPTSIAAFLYEIGFLTAREQLEGGRYKHYAFAEEPELLHSRTNPDRGMDWEIHPVFRQALGIRSDEGQEIRRRRKS